MKLTDWIPGDVKPVREGVYERQYSDICFAPAFCLFEDGIWRFAEVDIRVAARHWRPSPHQNLPWRGLAEQPK